MKKLASIFGILIFVPLLLGLLFLMPLELMVSSWHLYRTRDGLVHGKVIESREERHRGNSRSLIRCRYEVDGLTYETDRVRAGWISDHGFESGAGELGRVLRAGDTLPVYFDADQPGFALLEYGWPKGWLAVSLMVWGIILSSMALPEQTLLPSSRILRRHLWAYGAGKALAIVGFGIIMVQPTTIELGDLPLLGVCLGLVTIAAAGYGWRRYGTRGARKTAT